MKSREMLLEQTFQQVDLSSTVLTKRNRLVETSTLVTLLVLRRFQCSVHQFKTRSSPELQFLIGQM